MLIVDGHLDLALNALQGNRDLVASAYTVRVLERSMRGPGRGQGTVGFPEMRRGRVALSFVTVLARSTGRPEPHIDYATPAQAYGIAKGHLAYYHALAHQGHLRIVRNAEQLDAHLAEWSAWDRRHPGEEDGTPPPLGVVVTMESADPILEPGTLREWRDGGLRLLGPAHFGPGRYAGGTGCEDGLTDLGRTLLAEMARLGIILDVTHCSDQSFWDALARYDGPVHASHNNCRALNPHQRQLSDAQIRAIAERGGVIGIVPGCWQLKPGWRNGDSNESVSLADVVPHVDHICDIAGSSRHVGIGSDLDGGVGREGFAHDLDTIADLQKIAGLLADRGYSEAEVAAFMHGNWCGFLRRAWTGAPAAVRGS
jgi:membrane dipeptidase